MQLLFVLQISMSVEKILMIVPKSAETLRDPTDVNAGVDTDHETVDADALVG